jgi:HK97 family phage portal protein
MFQWLRAALGVDPEAVAQRAAASTRVLTATDYGRDILVNSPDGWEHDQRVLWWTGDGSPNGFGNPPPGAGTGNVATALPSVARCTGIIVDTIAGLPWRVYRGWDQLATPRWISDPQLLRPDGRVGPRADPVALSAVEFWANWLTAALWFGDGFVFAPNRDVDGAPKAPLYQLHPYDVTVDDRSGEWFTGGPAEGMGYWVGDVRLPEDQVMHLRGEPPYQGGRGQGVIDRHALELGLAATVRDYAGSVYGSGVPAGYLKVTAPQLTQPQADDLKARWMTAHGTSKRSIAVLNATTEFHPISISPIDAELTSSRQWALRDVALAFGVPPYMLGVPGDSATYANVESRMTELRTFTLLPWIRRAEATLDAQLPLGVEVKIATDGTLRADTSTRFAAYESALRAGWLTVDEVRALEDRPPLPEQVTTDPAHAEELPPMGEPAQLVPEEV